MSPQEEGKPGWSRIDLPWDEILSREKRGIKSKWSDLDSKAICSQLQWRRHLDKGKGTQRLLLCVKSVRKLPPFLEFSLFYFPLTLLWGWTRPVGNLNEVRGKASQPGIACPLWCSSGDILAWSFVSSPSHSEWFDMQPFQNISHNSRALLFSI